MSNLLRTWDVQADRHLFRPRRSRRFLVVRLTASGAPTRSSTDAGQRLSLVIDASRSMAAHARDVRRAARTLLDELTDRDEVALTIFHSQAEVVCPRRPATADAIAHILRQVKTAQGSGSAFRRGWLSGCIEIAETTPTLRPPPSRCWVLSDGGGQLTADWIVEAREVAARTSIVTTVATPVPVPRGLRFGGLVIPMQRVRSPLPDARPVGEIDLEITLPENVLLEVVGPSCNLVPVTPGQWRLDVDDMHAGESRDVVLRVHFRDYNVDETATLQFARGDDRQAVRFRCAPHADCDREREDRDVARRCAVPRAEEAWNKARRFEARRDVARALDEMQWARRLLERYKDDPEVQDLHARLVEEGNRLYEQSGR